MIVLNGRTTSCTVLDVEVTAAHVNRFAPGVRDERMQPPRESAPEAGFKPVVARSPDWLRVLKIRRNPRHRPEQIDRCGRRSIWRSQPSGVGKAGVWQPPIPAPHVRGCNYH